MGARWYDPVLSRWLSADTRVPEAGNPQALNRYAYVTNNPLNTTDPGGHMPCGMACPYDYTTWEINFGAAYGGAWDPGQQAGNRTRAAQVMGLMLDLMPGVGDVKGLIEVGTGRDLVSGEALGAWRWVGLLGLVGLAEARDLRHADEAAEALRAGKEVVQEAVEVAGRSGRPPIVIGENMAERVIPYAQQIGAQMINDFIPAERWSMEANDSSFGHFQPPPANFAPGTSLV